MSFNSLHYLLFLPVVWLALSTVGERWRQPVLLAASLVFYASLKVPYLLVALLLVMIVTYACGMRLAEHLDAGRRRLCFWSGVGGNLLVLVSLKYLSFLSTNLNLLAGGLHLPTRIQEVPLLVSIGVSFYVFQAISYLSDIYLEIQEPERRVVTFALYLSFFPKLLQGPIERAGDLLPQLRNKYVFNYENMRYGLLLFTWGLFKKVVVADRLALFVNPVYDNVHGFTGLPLLLATYVYAFQIYFDFSGYTDMALGSACLFNIRLTQNFNAPYLATSLADFWRRWHISFSRWILDYIFKPLQMHWRDWRTSGTALALLVTFIVSGIWHGASWGFVVWGLLHGVYLAVSVYYKPYQKKLHKRLGVEKGRLLNVWQVVVTFNLVCFAWIFFRANSIADAWYVVTHLISSSSLNQEGFRGLSVFIRPGKIQLLLAVFPVLLVFFSELRKLTIPEFVSMRGMGGRWSLYFVMVLSIVMFGVYNNPDFIYYRF